MVFLSKLLKSFLIFRSKESTAARTAIIENIPIVTPNNESKVLSLLLRNAFNANLKLSFNNRRYTNILFFFCNNVKFSKFYSKT